MHEYEMKCSSKTQVLNPIFQKSGYFSKKLFFQNFNWSNLIFDQSKSCLKNSVSLCLVRLIEPVFRSIEHRVSSFLKTVFWLIQTLFQKLFQTFLSLFDLARLHWRFFVVFNLIEPNPQIGFKTNPRIFNFSQNPK